MNRRKVALILAATAIPVSLGGLALFPPPPLVNVACGSEGTNLPAFAKGWICRRGCAMRVAAACVAVAQSYASAPGGCIVGWQYPEKSTPWLQKACDVGDGEACMELGVAYRDHSTRSREAEVVALFDRSCALGCVDGCSIGALQHATHGESETALRMRDRACSLGEAWECEVAAYMRAHSLGKASREPAVESMGHGWTLGYWDPSAHSRVGFWSTLERNVDALAR